MTTVEVVDSGISYGTAFGPIWICYKIIYGIVLAVSESVGFEIMWLSSSGLLLSSV